MLCHCVIYSSHFFVENKNEYTDTYRDTDVDPDADADAAAAAFAVV